MKPGKKHEPRCDFCNENGENGYCCSLLDHACKKLPDTKQIHHAIEQYRTFSGYDRKVSLCVDAVFLDGSKLP